MYGHYSSVPFDSLLMATSPHRENLASCTTYSEDPVTINVGIQISYDRQLTYFQSIEENKILPSQPKEDSVC